MLNDEQKKVIEANDRFLFLLAGAGSGKTRVIVEKIRKLIDLGMSESSILAITFTKKAAMEMRHRIGKNDVHVHTFHQFCYQQIKQTSDEAFSMINDFTEPFLRHELLAISLYKNSYFKTKEPKCYQRYQQYLKKHHLKDFDDLLIDMYRFVIKNPDHFNYKYIFIDEFQDTNALQYMLLKVLISKDTHVFAVGDPDQSIYRFRGAKNNIIDSYVKDFHATLYTLTVNYRSNQTIINHANRLIKRNNRTYKKDLNAVNAQKTVVYNIHFTDEKRESFAWVKMISLFQRQQIKLSEIAFLYRTHKRSFELKRALHETGISFQVSDDSHGYAKNGVQLMTIHQSKGLEFDVVVILGLEQGTLPSLSDLKIESLDEERRLMFVAMTRARHQLYYSTISKDTSDHPFTSSLFIRESGVKTIHEQDIDDIISIGDLNGYKTKNP